MTPSEILREAITKAVENGYKHWLTETEILKDRSTKYKVDYLILEYVTEADPEEEEYASIIFSHEFVKAFWGEKFDYFEKFDKKGVLHGELLWQYHLQQLALSEDRLKYIGRFL